MKDVGGKASRRPDSPLLLSDGFNSNQLTLACRSFRGIRTAATRRWGLDLEAF